MKKQKSQALDPETARLAEGAVAFAAGLGKTLDFSEASIEVVEALLAEAAQSLHGIDPGVGETIAQQFGCYLLVVGHRVYGGRTLWFEARKQPVLVVGEPASRIAIGTWDKCRARLRGDESEALPLFWESFASRARTPKAGDDVLIT